MKRLLIGGFAVGTMLFAATGVAGANTATPQAAPSVINLDALTTTSGVSGSSWPLATNPGSVAVHFATPASGEHISGYAVSCTAPQVDTKGNPLVNPKLVATFVVDPSTGTSADADYANAAGVTTLQVGPYDVVKAGVNPASVLPALNAYDHLGELPPLTCTVVASNAGGASKAGKPNKATAPAPSGDCSPDNTGTITGLENVLGGGGPTALYPVIGDNNDPPAADGNLATGIHVATQYSFVLADLTGFGGPAQVPFCSTNETYDPHLLSDQTTIFNATVSQIAAKTTGTGQHPAQIKVAGLKLTAPVKSSATLTVSGGAATLYVYDSAHFTIPAGGCPSNATVTCITNSAAIVGGGAPALPAGLSYLAFITNNPLTVLPGKPIVSAPGTVTFQKTGFTTGMPAAFFLMFGGSQTTISVGAAPGVPVQVAPPGAVIKALTSGATDGGDTNYTTPVLNVLSSLF